MVKQTAAEKLTEFTVRGTTISDADGVRHKPGSKIMLGKTLAEKFHKLGYLDIPLDKMYKEDKDAHIAALEATIAKHEAETAIPDAGDSAEGASKIASDSDGGEPASGDVATAADETEKPRRTRRKAL